MDFALGVSIALNCLSIYACFIAMKRLRALDQIELWERKLEEVKDRYQELDGEWSLWYDKFKHLAARIEHRKRKDAQAQDNPQDGTVPLTEPGQSPPDGTLSPKQQRILLMRRYRASNRG